MWAISTSSMTAGYPWALDWRLRRALDGAAAALSVSTAMVLTCMTGDDTGLVKRVGLGRAGLHRWGVQAAGAGCRLSGGPATTRPVARHATGLCASGHWHGRRLVRVSHLQYAPPATRRRRRSRAARSRNSCGRLRCKRVRASVAVGGSDGRRRRGGRAAAPSKRASGRRRRPWPTTAHASRGGREPTLRSGSWKGRSEL